MTKAIPSYRLAESVEQWVQATANATDIPVATLRELVNELKPGSFPADDATRQDVLRRAIATQLGRDASEDSAYLDVIFPFRGELAAHYQYAWGSHNATGLDEEMRDTVLAIGASEPVTVEWDEHDCVTLSAVEADPKDDARIAGRILREAYGSGPGHIVEISEVFNDDRKHSWAKELREAGARADGDR